MTSSERKPHLPLSAQQLTELLKGDLGDPQVMGKFIAELARSAACLTKKEIKKLKSMAGIREE